MKPRTALVLTLLLSIFAAGSGLGCGRKGPVTLPEEKKKYKKTSEAPAVLWLAARPGAASDVGLCV